MKKDMLITKVKRILLCIGLSIGIAFSSVMVGAFTNTNKVDAMAYLCEKARKSDSTDFTYVEAAPKKETFLFNDSTSSVAYTFDNYWHFENRPDIYAFRKWDKSLNTKTNETVYPLSFSYSSENYSVPIISIIGNRWEGDMSHLGLELENKNFKFDLKDTRAIQNSVILSHSLAKKMCDGDELSLIGTKVTTDVVFLNPYYNEAKYNNSSSSEVIDEMNIVGVFNEKSSLKMSRFTGEDFVFMFGGKEGAYNHCGLKIGCHLSTDDYANHVALSQILMFENDNSELTFYNYKSGVLVSGELQKQYKLNMSFFDSSLTFIMPGIFFIFLAGFITLYVWLILRSKTNLDLIVTLLMFFLCGILFSFVKMVLLGKIFFVLLNPFGCALYFACAIALLILLLRKPRSNVLKMSMLEEKNTRIGFIETALSFVVQIVSMTSLCVVIHSLKSGIRYFFLPSLVVLFGTFVILIFSRPQINFLEKKIKNSFLRLIIVDILPLLFCVLFGTVALFIICKFIPNFEFKISYLVLAIVGMIGQFVFIKLVSVLRKRLKFYAKKDSSQEINI